MRSVEEIRQTMKRLRDLRYNLHDSAEAVSEEYPKVSLKRAEEIQNIRIETIKNILSMLKKDSTKQFAKSLIIALNPFKALNPLTDSYISNVDYNRIQAENYLKMETCLVASYESKTIAEATQKGQTYYDKVTEEERNSSFSLYMGLAQNIAQEDGHFESKHL